MEDILALAHLIDKSKADAALEYMLNTVVVKVLLFLMQICSDT